MKRDNPFTDLGTFLLAVGALAFFPPVFDRELLILAWLGGLAQPFGLSAMVVGGTLFAFGKLRDFRNSSPVVSPSDLSALRPADPGEAQKTPDPR